MNNRILLKKLFILMVLLAIQIEAYTLKKQGSLSGNQKGLIKNELKPLKLSGQAIHFMNLRTVMLQLSSKNKNQAKLKSSATPANTSSSTLPIKTNSSYTTDGSSQLVLASGSSLTNDSSAVTLATSTGYYTNIESEEKSYPVTGASISSTNTTSNGKSLNGVFAYSTAQSATGFNNSTTEIESNIEVLYQSSDNGFDVVYIVHESKSGIASNQTQSSQVQGSVTSNNNQTSSVNASPVSKKSTPATSFAPLISSPTIVTGKVSVIKAGTGDTESKSEAAIAAIISGSTNENQQNV